MADIADLLMLSGVVRSCPDCHDERIFLPAGAFPTEDESGAYCCTVCGAALLIDPALDAVALSPTARVA
jgi:hypothetical protein